jgi:hypothetical protein
MRRRTRSSVDRDAEHNEWLALTERSGPFLTLPVLREAWPSLDAVDRATRDDLAIAHAEGGQKWLDWVLSGLLEWGDQHRTTGPDEYAYTEPQHDIMLIPSFVLDEPDSEAEEQPRLLGLVVPAGTHPNARIKGEAWPATPVDRMALLCRHNGVELGLVTDGRWWALVWAKRGGVTASCVFDSVTWPEAADRVVVRAFRSLLHRSRFFAVPDGEDGAVDQRLPALFERSGKDQEDVTDALGVQVRRAVEMLVDAIGRHDLRERLDCRGGIGDTTADEVYQAAVSVMMRIVFLLFAEERGLLPLNNPIYAGAYSAGRLADDLKQRADAGSEHELEHSHAAWRRLLALFTAVHSGVDHPRLTMPAYDGSIFDTERSGWLPAIRVDDRTVLHMLRSVQYVVVKKELRRLSFQALDVEQIGYVYEGLLSFQARRADEVYVGLVGKEGEEEEVRLADLERIGPDPAALAAAYKASGIGSAAAIAKRLVVAGAAQRAAHRARLLAVTDADQELTDRLLPYAGVIREDLRGQPTVILPGSLFVTASSQRADTGTHYTPRFLAEQVVEGALEPLVYSPGPLQTAEREQWKLRPSTEILCLKVADIAMGSGAFLVAACRYLAARLVHARAEEGDAAAIAARASAVDAPADSEADPVMVEARRQVIQHCLYGVDINPMAVEMAKLSLWLVSMDVHRPFTFVDDRLVCGDSLLGIGRIDVLGGAVRDLRLERDLAEVRRLRAAIAALPDDSLEALAQKRKLLDEAVRHTERAATYADLVVGAALASTKASKQDGERIATRAASLAGARVSVVREQASEWLATDKPDSAIDRQPLHWPLAFPEVFESGGFDAVIGNPPYLGGLKISETFGATYREYLVFTLANGVRGTRGTADLVAYFALRIHALIHRLGQTGLIATAALATGDTLEVGLQQITARDISIRQAIKSRPWPSKSAQLQCCQVWTSGVKLHDGMVKLLDGEEVGSIGASLDEQSRVAGIPHRLIENAGVVFQGSNILGLGFALAPDEGHALVCEDPRNADVLFPYLIGQDVNNRPDHSASRWVINFHDWPEDQAKRYRACYGTVRRLVKPERDRNKQKARRERWWQYSEYRRGLVRAIEGLDHVIVITLVSATMMPVRVPARQVFAHKLGVFATDSFAFLAFVSSSPHYLWAVKHSSPYGSSAAPVYTPDRGFATLARPLITEELRAFGERLDAYRRDLMLARNAGLTATYNLVHSPKCRDDDIEELRRIHVAIDEAVANAYGWHDLALDHGFHPTRQGTRYTVDPATRQEILDRLLEENHRRYAAEQAGTQDGLF